MFFLSNPAPLSRVLSQCCYEDGIALTVCIWEEKQEAKWQVRIGQYCISWGRHLRKGELVLRSSNYCERLWVYWAWAGESNLPTEFGEGYCLGLKSEGFRVESPDMENKTTVYTGQTRHVYIDSDESHGFPACSIFLWSKAQPSGLGVLLS